jgi:hypothetical protein
MKFRLTLVMMPLILGILISIYGVVISVGAAVPTNATIAGNNSAAYSVPTPELVVNWWVWWEGIPNNEHPEMKYPDAGRCSVMQQGPVWFLPDASNVNTDVNNFRCNVPVGKSMMLPLTTSECNYGREQQIKTDDDLKECAYNILTPLDRMEVVIDGIKADNSKLGAPVRTEFFNITYPQDPAQIWGGPVISGTHKAIAEGYFLILPPMAAGKHTVGLKVSDSLKGLGDQGTRNGYYEIFVQ